MKKNNASIGLFVIGGLLLFGIGMFLIGDRHQAFARHIEYYSEFTNLAGLANGATVRVAGMDAGKVVAIRVPDSPSSRFRVKWQIDAKLHGLVRTDSLVVIGTEGLVGGTYLSVRTGSPQSSQAAALATIPSKEAADLSVMLEKGAMLLNDAQGTLKDVGARLDGTLDIVATTVSNVNDVVLGLKKGRGTAGMLLSDDALAKQIRGSITTTTSDVQGMVADLKAGRGPAGMLLRDEAVSAQIKSAIKNAQQATTDLSHASQQADALVADLKAREIPKKAGQVMDSLNDSARQVNQVIAEINKPDKYGMSPGANVRESLTNANTATVNLAEGTEALKHNLFLRGFFKKRGFYNLAEITPEEYRRDSTFTNQKNRRVWLTGAELFERGPNGQEELSARGKDLLNHALTENGDPILTSPIVIEGYWNADAPAEQLRLSRSRAVLVRQYLQARFQLDSRGVGVVPLKNSPPNGIEHATWDGICIVVLRRS